MKWTAVFLCMALVAVQAVSIQNDLKHDMSLMEKQMFIYQLVFHVSDDLMFEELIKFAVPLITDESYFTVYDEDMHTYAQLYVANRLLPRNAFFSAMQQSHMSEQKALFKFMYYAKDTEAMLKIMAWARMHVCPQIFVNALTMTVVHRRDLAGIVLPPIYEIFPHMFLSSKYIMAAQNFNWDLWNQLIMYEKELKGIYAKQQPSQLYGKQFYQMGFKAWQWWKLMGLDDEWHLEGKSMLRNDYSLMRKDPMMMSIYSQLKMVWMPIDYSRDVEIMNEEAKLAYFTEDVAWNSYWYYLNQDYSMLLDSTVVGLENDRRGEWWLYNVQQLLARYYMERLSQGLGEIDDIPWHGAILNGYHPQLIAHNGIGYSMRKNYYEVQTYDNPASYNTLLKMEHKTQEIFSAGKYMLKNGTWADLTIPEAREFFGNLLQGNLDVVGMYPWLPMVAAYLGGGDYHADFASPNVMCNFETMLRDPMAYQLFKTIVDMTYMCKHQLPAYTKKELGMPGVQILNVDVSELKTYYDLVDVDMSTLMKNQKMVHHEGKFVWDHALLGRQMRLNHEPFNFELTVASETAQKVVIRIFLGPEFDQYGRKMDMADNLEYYMELDQFMYDLVAGQNTIVRKSENFDWTRADAPTYTELYNYLVLGMEGKFKYNPQIFESHSLFPDRLILPHGWVEGMPMGLFFMISPYHPPSALHETNDHFFLSGIGSGTRHIDDMPFGYPLDRPIRNLVDFIVPNMFYKTVMIYHREAFSKYYPMMYEHFGAFDESF